MQFQNDAIHFLGCILRCVIQTPRAIYIFEFKLDNDPTALEQIKEKEYFKKYLLDKREIYIIGVNFDTAKGTLIGWEDEKIVK